MDSRTSIGAVLLVLAWGAAAAGSPEEFHYLGRFSDMQFTEEHQYGSEVEVWAAGDRVVGFYSWSDGLIGDTPTGIIDDVVFEPRTGALRFTAKITSGNHYCKVHEGVPSRDLFKFDGALQPNALTGELSHLEALDNDAVISREQVVLEKVVGEQASGQPSITLSEFQARAMAIPELRKAKW